MTRFFNVFLCFLFTAALSAQPTIQWQMGVFAYGGSLTVTGPGILSGNSPTFITCSTAQRDSKLSSISNSRAGSASGLITQNSALSGSGTHLANEKTVNGILLQTIASGGNYFSATQLATLQSIAAQCPLTGGDAVLVARDMLKMVLEAPVFYNDDVLCLVLPDRATKKTGLEDATILVFPNPATDEISIQYNLGDRNCARLRFFNVYGQPVHEITLNKKQGDIVLPVNNYTSGVYYYTLEGGNSGAIVINH